MRILCEESRFSRLHNRRRKGGHGRTKTCWDSRLASPNHTKTSQEFYRILQLLQKIHPSLFRHLQTPQLSITEEQSLGMDQRALRCLQQAKGSLRISTSSHHPRLFETVYHC